MNNSHEQKAEIAVLQSIFQNALYDLSLDEYPMSGELCEDIRSLGYAQNIAVESIFDSFRLGVIKKELAARVCESCIQWLDCERKVLGKKPMDEANPFVVFEWDRTISDEGVISPVTTAMKQGATWFTST